MDELTKEAKSEMEKAIQGLKNNLKNLRTGRASAAMLDNIMVDYYGDKISLTSIAAVSIPEPRQLLIKPYDRNDVKAIVAAISSSNLGLNPMNEGNLVRLIIPALTEERRREIAKDGKKYVEEAKVAIRNVRRDYLDLARGDDSMSEDIVKRIEKEIQDVTDESNKLVDAIYAEKEKEIMAI